MPTLRLFFALLFLATLTHCTPARVATDAPPEPPVAEVAQPEEVTDEGMPEAEPVPNDWYQLDNADGFHGISTEKAYRMLLDGREPRQTVVVAVLDSGVDIEHEDLAGKIWVNEDEVPDNGIDDDGNGYVDDVHGWNFIGGPNGRHVNKDTYEVTREYVRLSAKYGDVDPESLSPEQQEDYAYYERVRDDFEGKTEHFQNLYVNIGGAYEAVQRAKEILRVALPDSAYSADDLRVLETEDDDVDTARNIMLWLDANGLTEEIIAEQFEFVRDALEYGYNPDFNPRDIVGDDYDDVDERIYGNNDVEGPDAKHGTHVAGIIAADRDNGIGAAGIARAVRIMSVRTVPDGDERDKDVANAIRYAVDNGARIINMSFGKDYSPQKDVVDAAVRYAAEKGVLLVHGAGNDGANVDTTANFPTRYLNDGQDAANWIEVGATSWDEGPAMIADFSNYGRESVDVFAPGVDIYSTLPNDTYQMMNGTSMASPVVAGIAALVWSYYPDLTAEEVKAVLLESAVDYPDLVVDVSGGSSPSAAFGTLSRTGAIVNAYEALRLAAQRSE